MPFVAVPATIKASLFYTLNGQPAMNRIHVGVSATLPTVLGCAGVATALADWWLGNAQGLVGPTMALRAVEAISIAEPNGPQFTFSAGLPAAGTGTSPCLPGNNAFCVSLRTGLTGRSARGRWYWAGLQEGQVVENVVDSGAVASIVGAIDNLKDAILAIDATPVIVSYVANKAPRPGGPVKFVIIDALATDNIVDSQRGRLH